MPRQLCGYGRSDWSTKLIRGLTSEAPAGFQSRRRRHQSALVTFQYAAFPTYKAQYLKIYPDVAAEVQRGTFLNGYHHYLTAGRAQGRKDGTPPSDWNEALYLRLYRMWPPRCSGTHS